MRRRSLTALLSGGLLLITTAAVTVMNTGSAAGATSTCPATTLSAGQHLIADTRCSQLHSPDGRFILYVEDADLTMYQNVHGAGEPAGTLDIWTGATWTQWSYNETSRRNMTLTMERNGNLVLAGPRGAVFWQTNTAGSGATHLVLRDSGRLLLLTASGKRVWASNSGVYALGGGDRVGSGGFLMETTNWGATSSGHPGVSQVRVSRMLTTGDFVSYCMNSKRVYWHTNTHTPGSYITMLEDGRLVVESPSGRILWSSPTRGWRGAFTAMGTQITGGPNQFWYARGPEC
ncbi:MAG: hypothetical protein ACTHJM_15250 [Marmoricola sp.]